MSKSQHKGKELPPLSVIQAAKAGDCKSLPLDLGRRVVISDSVVQIHPLSPQKNDECPQEVFGICGIRHSMKVCYLHDQALQFFVRKTPLPRNYLRF